MRYEQINRWFLSCAAILLLLWTVFPGPGQAEPAKTFTVSPEILEINGGFEGGRVTISGTLDSSEDVVIEVTAKDTETSFELKGKKGPFWMTKGKIHISHVPEIYLLLLPEGDMWEQKVESAELGIDHLKKGMQASGNVDVPPDIFSMFAKLKKNEGLYRKIPDAVKYSKEGEGTKRFEAVCPLPAGINTGTYNIIATTISKNGKTRRMKGSFSVREVGFVKLMNNLAFNYRLVYGITAVVIAILAGLLMGIVCRGGGGGH